MGRHHAVEENVAGSGGAAGDASETALDLAALERDVPSCKPTVFKFDDEAPQEEASEEFICSVCLLGLEPGEQVRTLPCGHVFHRPCVDRWFSRSNRCPLCRQSPFTCRKQPVSDTGGTAGAATTGGTAGGAPTAETVGRPSEVELFMDDAEGSTPAGVDRTNFAGHGILRS